MLGGLRAFYLPVSRQICGLVSAPPPAFQWLGRAETSVTCGFPIDKNQLTVNPEGCDVHGAIEVGKGKPSVGT
jgi:hypothetical protein